jgi:Steigviridae/Suoliviridae L,D-carboxypeptidase/transpeptidase
LNVEVRRNLPTRHSTSGRLAIDGFPLFVTLEPPPVPDISGNGCICIPACTSALTIRWSWEFKKMVPHVEDVPGRNAIENHIGNYPRDTKGCTLIGTDYGDPFQPDFIRWSDKAFAAYMTRLYAGATLTNPDASEIDHIWDCGIITYVDYVPGGTQ